MKPSSSMFAYLCQLGTWGSLERETNVRVINVHRHVDVNDSVAVIDGPVDVGHQAVVL